jgi:hypothetical protein
LLQRFSIHIGPLLTDTRREVAHQKAGYSPKAAEKTGQITTLKSYSPFSKVINNRNELLTYYFSGAKLQAVLREKETGISFGFRRKYRRKKKWSARRKADH